MKNIYWILEKINKEGLVENENKDAIDLLDRLSLQSLLNQY